MITASSIKYNELIDLPIPTRINYVFVGWGYSSGNLYTNNFGIGIKPFNYTYDLTFTAYWQSA